MGSGKLASIVALASVVTLAGGCATENRLDRLEDRARALVENVECEDISECRAMPFGDKPCGGPWEYLVYSTRSTDPAELADVVDQHRQLEQRYNERHEVSSTCEFVEPPTLVCDAGECRDANE